MSADLRLFFLRRLEDEDDDLDLDEDDDGDDGDDDTDGSDDVSRLTCFFFFALPWLWLSKDGLACIGLLEKWSGMSSCAMPPNPFSCSLSDDSCMSSISMSGIAEDTAEGESALGLLSAGAPASSVLGVSAVGRGRLPDGVDCPSGFWPQRVPRLVVEAPLLLLLLLLAVLLVCC